jgi:hypothetical protein
VKDLVARYRASAQAAKAVNDPAFGKMGEKLGAAVDALERATDYMLAKMKAEPDAALAGATPYLRLFALGAGGAMLADQALAARAALTSGETDPLHAERIRNARYFAENLCVGAEGLETTVTEGGEVVNAAYADLLN